MGYLDLMRRIVPRIFAQGLLTLTGFVISITAAHELSTASLAVFFIAWTLESLWVGAVRTVAVPAILLSRQSTPLIPLIGIALAAAIPLVAAIVVVAIQALPVWTAVLLGLSAWSLASYELARTVLSRRHSASAAIAFLDGGLLVLCLIPVGVSLITNSISLDIALGSLVSASVIMCVIATYWPVPPLTDEKVVTLREWLGTSTPLLRIGFLEWVVFAGVSLISLAIMATLGGAEVVAGIRLGETLTAPIGIVASALPLIIASSLREQDSHSSKWPSLMKHVLIFMMVGTCGWLAFILFGPSAAVSLFVGDHVEIARQATLGLSLGVLASLFAASATLFMKHRGQMAELRWLRWGQLSISVPFVAAGALTGTVVLTGLAISAYQMIGAAAQAALQRRSTFPRDESSSPSSESDR